MLCLLAFVTSSRLSEAYVRMYLDGNYLSYNNPNITWHLNPSSFGELNTPELQTAAEIAFQRWQDVDRSAFSFTRGADTTDTRVGTVNGKTPNKVFMDSTNSTGYFPNNSGVVALTLINYSTGSGSISDADIFFNGRKFDFSFDGTPSTFDVQDVLTHEVGHLLGLDHSPVHSGTMWPYVVPNQDLHRSLHADDRSAAIDAAREGGIITLKGRIHHQDGSPVSGAGVGVVRRSDGQLAATALTTSSGGWRVRGIPQGDYSVYCFPIEGRMNPNNFTSEGAVDLDFGCSFYGGWPTPSQFSVSPGETLDIGTMNAADDFAFADNEGTATQIELLPGSTRSQSIVVLIPGFTGSGTLFELSPYISLSSQQSLTGALSATVNVPHNTPPGSYDLYAELPGGELEIIPGAIEIVEAAPIVNALTGVQGGLEGGHQIQIHGENFQADPFVIIGGRLASEVTRVDSQTLTVRTPAGDGGYADVVVQNRDGRESRLPDAYLYAAVPVYEDSFPRAGQLSGGTKVRITGSGFVDGMTVTVAERPATVRVLSQTVVEVTSPAGLALGDAPVVLRSAEGFETERSGIFAYVSMPDPTIESFTPQTGKKSGGTEVNLFGDNLVTGVKVRFGVDAVSGLGGQYSGRIERMNSEELVSETPGGPPGAGAVAVELPNGQGVMASSSFSYQSLSTGGGCGGVVHGARPGRPIDCLPWLLCVLYWRLLARPRQLARVR